MYAYKYKQLRSRSSVIWVYVADRARFFESYATAAEGLQIADRNQGQIEAAKVLLRWLNNPSNGPWLLILDGADDPAIFNYAASDAADQPCLTEYLPNRSNIMGSVLVTTRNKRVGMDLTNHREPINVDVFGVRDAKDLLRRKLGPKRSNALATDEEEKLLEQLMHLPLAISQAAAFIVQDDSSVSRYSSTLEKAAPHSSNMELLNTDKADAQRDRRARNAVFGTWKISYERISTQEPVAARFLSLMAVYDKQRIPLSLLSEGDECKEQVALSTLKAYALVTVLADENLVTIHRLVQLSIQSWLQQEETLTLTFWKRQGLAVMAGKLPFYSTEAHKECSLLERHAMAILDFRDDEGDRNHRGQVLLHLASYESHIGRYVDAHKRTVQAYTIFRLDESQQELMLRAVVHAAFVLSQTGKLPEAELLLRKTTRRLDSRPQTPSSLTEGMCKVREELALELAEVLFFRGTYKDALAIQMELYDDRLKRFGPHGLLTLSSLRELGRVFTKQGEYTQAEVKIRECFEQRKRLLGKYHADTLSSGNQLAMILQYRDLPETLIEAAELHRFVSKARRDLLGPDHPLTLTSLHNLEATLTYQELYDEAIPINQQVYKSRTRVLGEEHQDTITSLNNKAILAARTGQLDDALLLLRQCYMGRQHILGSDHEQTFGTKISLAKVYTILKQFENASRELDGLYDQHVRVLGASHSQTKRCLDIEDMFRKESGALKRDRVKPTISSAATGITWVCVSRSSVRKYSS
jgi:tetratricopeptide (TPR) repeat protein